MTAGKTCRLSFSFPSRGYLHILYSILSIVDVFAQVVGDEWVVGVFGCA
jgi:hypothetical protein